MKTEAEIQEAANMLARLLVNGGAESRTIAGELVALEWVLGNDHPNHAGSLTRLLDTLRQEGLPR